MVGPLVALGVMVAACGDSNDSTTADGSETSALTVARDFVDAVDSGDFDVATTMVAEDVTVECYREEQFVGPEDMRGNLCWMLEEVSSFTPDADAASSPSGVVYWAETGGAGIIRWEAVMEATISDGVITALVLTETELESVDPRDDSLPTTEWGSELEIGQTYRYDFWIHCGMDVLGEFNGSLFALVEAPRGQRPTPDWPTRPDELLALLTLVDGDTIELSIPPGEVIGVYEVSDEVPPECA